MKTDELYLITVRGARRTNNELWEGRYKALVRFLELLMRFHPGVVHVTRARLAGMLDIKKPPESDWTEGWSDGMVTVRITYLGREIR